MNRQSSVGLLTQFRHPEYTGENRCLPCTVINLALATALTGVMALVSLPAAVVVAVVSIASIYVRGYLVPGTPELTKRYLPERVLAWFGKSTSPAATSDVDFDVFSFLDRAAVVVDGDDDIALVPTFQSRLEAVALDINTDAAMTTASADLLDVDADRLSFVSSGSSWRVLLDDSILGQWESKAAFVADLAAHRALSEWTDEWESVPGGARGRTLSAIRACLETCPVCAGEIRLGTESVRSCCREYEVVAATCLDCNARLFETDARSVVAVE